MTQLERLKQKNKSLSDLIIELNKCINSRNELIQFIKTELKECLEKNEKLRRENKEQYAQIAVLRERIDWYSRKYSRIAMHEGLSISDRLN